MTCTVFFDKLNSNAFQRFTDVLINTVVIVNQKVKTNTVDDRNMQKSI